jgi:hypothetical protein
MGRKEGRKRERKEKIGGEGEKEEKRKVEKIGGRPAHIQATLLTSDDVPPSLLPTIPLLREGWCSPAAFPVSGGVAIPFCFSP